MKRCVFIFISAIFVSFTLAASAFALEQVQFVREIKDIAIGAVTDVAVDESGDIYISDSDKKMVWVLDKDGKQKASWGGKVKSPDGWQFKSPAGIYVNGDRVYVTDSSQDKVFIFSKDGKLIESFGQGGDGPKEFSSPMGICVVKGVIYVADSGNRRIQFFSLDGIYTGSFGGKDILQEPRDVAVDYRGYIAVADAEKIKFFTPSGKLDSTFHAVLKPGAVAVDKRGFYGADNASYMIGKYDFKGNPILTFGAEGREKGQFRKIGGLSLSASGEIYVADPKNNSVQVFSVKLDPVNVEESPSPTSVKWTSDIKVAADSILWDGKGKLYGVRKKDNVIFVIENSDTKVFTSAPKTGWKKPSGLAVDAEGSLWVVDTGNDRVLKLDGAGGINFSFGSSGSKNGYFSDPTDIVISSGGVIYVADTGNERVQAFNIKDGVFLKIIGEKEGASKLYEPNALALDSEGNIYILDAKPCKVMVFSPAGKLLGGFGSEGEGRGQFKEPSDIMVSPTEIFVLDSGNKRVQVFDLRGKYLREFGAEGRGKGDFLSAASFTVKDVTRILIADPEAERVQVLTSVYTPRTPQNLKAEGGMRKVGLKWEGSDEAFLEGYKIYRSSNNLEFRELASVRQTSYEDSTIDPEKAYYYRVAAYAAGGNESGRSGTVQVTAIKYVPPAPAWFSTTPGERNVVITWEPPTQSFVTSFNVYKEDKGQFKLMAKTQQPSYIDNAVRPETAYSYKLTSVSSDGIESDAVNIKAVTLKQTKPPVDLVVGSMGNVFSNNYKIYENEPLGAVKVSNNTWEPISKLKVTFMIKEFMDYPSEKTVENLQPWQTVDVPLHVVFNNRVLEITENTSVQAALQLSYYENRVLQTYTVNQPVTIYEMHHLTWDVRDRVAIFVTPKDPVVLEFAREVARQYSDVSPDPLIQARAVFDALGVIGLSYMPDPSNPYQTVSEKSDQVDYIQYPRETLLRKTGDCDDLVNLYSSALESLGIQTALVDVPGHIFMMFSTGMDKDLIQSAEATKDMFVMYKDTAWIPVEVTLVGSSFLSAWKKGVSTYGEWLDKGLQIIDLRRAWEGFKPASLPATSWRAEKVRRSEIESQFADELDYLRSLRIRYLSKRYLDILASNPSDVGALLQVGIIYGENGNEKAAEFFRKVIALDPGNAAAKNNLGNVLYRKGSYQEARSAYAEASALEPGDYMIWMNLAKTTLKIGDKAKAKEAFDRAYRLNPTVAEQFRNIAFQVGDPALLLNVTEEPVAVPEFPK